MSIFTSIHPQFDLMSYLEMAIRIMAAAACGGIVGIERSRRFKDAGVRTHCIVACTAAIMMIISKYGFYDLTDAAGGMFPGTRGADPARIAAQIVSGVSFLGAGIIYRDKHLSTKGLTTAAGIWAVAGIGMAWGSGLYVIGLFSTLFVMLLQWLTHRYQIGNDKYVGAELDVVVEDDTEAINRLHEHFRKWGIVVTESAISREENLMSYELEVKLPSKKLQQEITATLAADPAVRSVKLSDVR